MRKLITKENYVSRNGNVQTSYVHDISRPNAIIISIENKTVGSFDADSLSDVVKSLIDLQKKLK